VGQHWHSESREWDASVSCHGLSWALESTARSSAIGHLKGQLDEVLVEGRKKGRWWGRTRTGKLVFFEDEGDWQGRLAQVRITWTGPWSLIGEAEV
jgi:tRNA A37 methylthiotransferase MiaB